MPLTIEYINEYTLLLRYTGLLNFEDRLQAYQEVHNYMQNHPVKFILLNVVESMYFEDQIADPRLSEITDKILLNDNLIAVVTTSNNNVSLSNVVNDVFISLGIGQKFRRTPNLESALELIANLEAAQDEE